MAPRPNPALSTSRRLAAGTLVAGVVAAGGLGVELAHAQHSTSAASTAATTATATGTTTGTSSSDLQVAAGSGMAQARTSGS